MSEYAMPECGKSHIVFPLPRPQNEPLQKAHDLFYAILVSMRQFSLPHVKA